MIRLILRAFILVSIFVLPYAAYAEINPVAEKYISSLLNRKTPYTVQIAGIPVRIDNNKVYPPGRLANMFAEYLLKNNLIADRIFVDISVGCLPIGIVAAKYGAKKVIGNSINEYYMSCIKDNMQRLNIKDKIELFDFTSSSVILNKYKGKADVVVGGLPWDRVTLEEFNNIAHERKSMSAGFYDIDDNIMSNFLNYGKKLLSPSGRMFTTASKRMLPRLERLCLDAGVICKIVKEKDLHRNKDTHYTIEVIAS